MKRLEQIGVKLSSTERQIIYENSGRTGLSPQDFIRKIATHPKAQSLIKTE
ncbi:plasmid mobilization protein [Synechocystis salina]|uniref:plasmid mobilization protein n=1 Tax=Synechocystis salina TaxID=945780 RepID=UPI003B839102